MSNVSLSDVLQIAGVLTALVTAVMAALVFLVTRNKSKSDYDVEMNRALLSEMRASYEHQMARLSSQLMATEDRWRETNHLLISSQNSQPDRAPATRPPRSQFVAELGIDQESIKVDLQQVFFLTPFSNEERELYDRVQRICSKIGLRCLRGDETQASGEILPHIVRMILESRFVIANITSRNPNVFYELGIAHALDKRAILIAKSAEELPFDVQSRRTIIYRDLKLLDPLLTRTISRMLVNSEIQS